MLFGVPYKECDFIMYHINQDTLSGKVSTINKFPELNVKCMREKPRMILQYEA